MRRAPSLCAVLASMLLAGAAIAPNADAAGVDPTKATQADKDRATKAFLHGRTLYTQKKYAEALADFRASVDAVDSPNARLYVARCLADVGQLAHAYTEYTRTLTQARQLATKDPKYQASYDAATTERAELEPKLGVLVLSVEHAPPDTKLSIAGEEILREEWGDPKGLAPGSTEIVVTAPGHEPVKRSVTMAAGQKQTLTIDAQGSGGTAPNDVKPPPTTGNPDTSDTSTPPPGDTSTPPPLPPDQPPEDRSKVRPYAYAAAGLGLVGMVTFVIFALEEKSTYNDLNAQCHGPCPPDKQDEVSTGKTQETIANIGLAVGLIGLATGAGLYLWSTAPTGKGANASVVVAPGWIGVRGKL